MSAPDTNLKKQGKRHRVSLIAMAVIVVIFVALMLIYWPAEEAVRSDGPEGAAVQVDGRTGTTETGGDAFDTDPVAEGDGIVAAPAPTEPAAPVVDPALSPLVEDPVEPGVPELESDGAGAPDADTTDGTTPGVTPLPMPAD